MSHAREIQQPAMMPGYVPWRRSLNSFQTSLQVSFRRILFATDFSAAASRALPYAVEIARRSEGMLYAVHVISPRVSPAPSPEEWSQIEQEQEKFRARGQSELEQEIRELPHEILFRKGDVWENLKKVIADKDVDLIVMGTHGRTGFAKSVVGSVTEKVFRQASCPVLTVGPHVHPVASHAAAAELNCILYATDFSPESLAAARFAISLARDHHADLVLLHADEAGADGNREASLETLKNVVPLGAGLTSKPAYLMERGEPADAILQAAKSTHADLIVLGARSVEKHLTAAIHFSDSIAGRVAANAACPVLIVHS
jgi:nucleotide-binding universal stress UspA family protein